MRLTEVRNGSKQTIYVSDQFTLLQMMLELDTVRCANEDAGPSRGVDCEISYRFNWSREENISYKGAVGPI